MKNNKNNKNPKNFKKFFKKIIKFKPKISPQNYPLKQSINAGIIKKPLIDRGYRRAVFIVVYKIERDRIFYLLLKRKLHWVGWEFPKGGIEIRESPEVSVRRECYEETGLRPLKVTKFNYSGKYRYPGGFPDRLGIIGQTYTLFSAEIANDRNLKIDTREHETYLWLPFSKAVKKLTHKDQKRALRAVNNFLMKTS